MTLDAYHAQMAEIRNRFGARIAARIARLREIQADLANSEAAREEMHQTLHDIAGTGPSLGFAALGAEARRLEIIVADAVKQARPFGRAELADIERGLSLLAQEAQQADVPATSND